MTKIYDIIHLNGQSYMVDKAFIAKGDYHWMGKAGARKALNDLGICDEGLANKVIASTDSSLGLPLLPAVEEDENETQILDKFDRVHSSTPVGQYEISAFLKGYKAAKGKYTEEDMIRAILRGAAFGMQEKGTLTGLAMTLKEGKAYEILQSLNPLPKQVEVECIESCGGNKCSRHGYLHPDEPCDGGPLIPKTVNNIVVVKRWIYE